MTYTVFILSCADQSFHIGTTKNRIERFAYHNNGLNRMTANKRPVELVYEKSFEFIQDALFFEKALKESPQKKIQQLLKGEIEIEASSTIEHATIDSPIAEISPLVLPAVYFGNRTYFERISTCTQLLLDGEERYEKQTFRSRCTILSANGVQNLVIPVIRPNGKDTCMKDIRISYAENWQKDHLKAIESAYRKAPFYDFYADELTAIIETAPARLIDLNLAITRTLVKLMGWTTSVQIAGQDQNSTIEDKRLVHPKTCPNTENEPYHQIFGESGFEANLSIIDWLFNVGKKS